MADILEIHDQILDYLLMLREDNPDLTFSLRRSNRDGKLEDGYWFYGNESYLAVSFWSGNDWKNRTPNVIFVVTPDRRTSLEINVSDSEGKKDFAERFLKNPLQMTPVGKGFRKYYEWQDHMISLMEFMQNDKVIIDNIVRGNSMFFDTVGGDKIGFIPVDDFEDQLSKVLDYRAKAREQVFPMENKGIQSIGITNYGPIRDVNIENIPENTKWIFITGENGSGKTSILKGIATMLANEKIGKDELNDEADIELKCSLYSSDGTVNIFSRGVEKRGNSKQILISGLASYGASRLTTNHPNAVTSSMRNFRSRTSTTYGLFHGDGILYDLMYKYRRWENTLKDKQVQERFDYIKEVLYELVPNLNEIAFDYKSDPPTTLYIEEDENADEESDAKYKAVPFTKLASGIRSMVAMFGDMMCRLFEQQPYKTDPSELTGVVIIDEIDIHLHPILQKRIVEQLTKTFTGIQFIATTHSPIPILGAPENSKIFYVSRNINDGVQVRNMDHIDFSNLLPNTLLTSPIFGLEEIKPTSNKDPKQINVDDSIQDTQFFALLDEKLEELEKKQNLENNKFFDDYDSSE